MKCKTRSDEKQAALRNLCLVNSTSKLAPDKESQILHAVLSAVAAYNDYHNTSTNEAAYAAAYTAAKEAYDVDDAAIDVNFETFNAWSDSWDAAYDAYSHSVDEMVAENLSRISTAGKVVESKG